MNNKLIPRLRFEGFNDEWDSINIGSVASVITKGTSPKIKVRFGDVNFIKVEDIDTDNGNININHYISKEENDNHLKRSKLKDGDILFSIAGTLGKIGIVNKNILPANTNQALAIIRLDGKENISFLTTILKGKTVKEYIRKNPTIGAQPNLSLKQISNLSFNNPSLLEQQQIGAFFAKLNRMIELQFKKINHLKQLKKGYLQKMFTQKGKNVPKLRFDGFKDEWNKNKLGNVVNLDTGYSFRSNLFSFDGKYLVVTNSNIKNNSALVDTNIGNHINIQNDNLISKYKLYGNQILITMDGNVGRSAKISNTNHTNMVLAQRVARVKSKSNNYFYSMFNTQNFKCDMMNKSHGGTIKHISLNDIKKYNMHVPSIQEQNKIGRFFKYLDQSINQQENKLNQLKILKKAYLQKMFI